MKIVVCVKRVPDTETRVRLLPDRSGIDTSGVKFVTSPYDEYALESALRVKDASPETEVVAVSLGEPAAAEQLRAALAMGADRAVLLRAEPVADGLAVARALAARIETEAADLALFGVKAADDDLHQVGPMAAELLNWPCVTAVTSFTLEGGGVTAHREVDGGVEVVETSLPVVITITKGAYEPRYASLKGIMAAKRKPLEEVSVEVSDSRVRVLELSLPPEKPPARIVGEGPDAVPELVRLLIEEAGAL